MGTGMDLTQNGATSEDIEKGQAEEKKLRYPRTVFFIVTTEFCERFAYYGMRAVLTVYMRNILNFSDDQATTIYHVFLFLCYFLPIFGAVLADSFVGRYRTILILSSIFAVGNLLLTAASVPPLHLPVTTLSLIGLFLMAVGTGGIKPCVAPLGGDQFILPQQERLLKQFFSVFAFAVSVGNMCSTMITPVLRGDIQCFSNDCYPLAFGVPAGLMIIALGVFVAGRPFYVINKPKDNIILRVIQVIVYAIKRRREETSKQVVVAEKTSEKKHWVDYANHKGSKFDRQLIQDTKGLLRVLVYYLPVPMFWALYEQLGSRWTLQATRMNGNFGGSFSIQPDQMQVANAILMFAFIPIFETCLYPMLAKCHVFQRPLQRMVVGGLLAALAFLFAGLVEMEIEKTDFKLPSMNRTHLSVVNTLPCPVRCDIRSADGSVAGGAGNHVYSFEVQAQFNTIVRSVRGKNLEMLCSTITRQNNGGKCSLISPNMTHLSWSGKVNTLQGKLQSLVIAKDCLGTGFKVYDLKRAEDTTKSKDGYAKLSIVTADCIDGGGGGRRREGTTEPMRQSVTVEGHSMTRRVESPMNSSSIPRVELRFKPGSYAVKVGYLSSESNVTESVMGRMNNVKLGTGGNYMIVFYRNSTGILTGQLVTVINANEIHMLWLLPQYIVMAWGEVLFMISGMEFSFTEAPLSMKSVLQGCFHLTNACGNLMVIIAAQTKGNMSQASEFFIFASLMFVDAIIFGFMASRYKYVNLGKDDHSTDNSITSEKEKMVVAVNEDEDTRL